MGSVCKHTLKHTGIQHTLDTSTTWYMLAIRAYSGTFAASSTLYYVS